MENMFSSEKCNLQLTEARWMICEGSLVLAVSSKNSGLSNHSCAGSLPVVIYKVFTSRKLIRIGVIPNNAYFI